MSAQYVLCGHMSAQYALSGRFAGSLILLWIVKGCLIIGNVCFVRDWKECCFIYRSLNTVFQMYKICDQTMEIQHSQAKIKGDNYE